MKKINYNDFLSEIIKFETNQNWFNSSNYKEILLNNRNDKYERLYIYSSIYEKEYLKNNKDKAAFYTNLDVAYSMVKLAFKDYEKEEYTNLKILDPAVWSGIFIFALIKFLEKDLKLTMNKIEGILNKNVFSWDLDVQTLDFFLFLLKNVLNINYKNTKKEDFFLTKNKYDIILWNPPYWLSLKEIKEDLSKNLNLNPSEISNDSYGLFYIKAFSLLKENWTIVFITPWSFLNIKQHYGLRKYIIDDIDTIILLPKNIFKNRITNIQPWIEAVICKIKKNNTNKKLKIINNKLENQDWDISIFNVDVSSKDNILEIKKRDIKNIYHLPLSFYLTQDLIDILTNKKLLKVKDFFDSTMWIKTANNKKFISSKKTNEFKDKFIKWTSKEPQSMSFSIYDYIDIEDLKKDRPKNSNIPQEQFLDKWVYKIWIPEIWHKWIITAFKYKEEYVSNSVWIYIPKKEFYSEKFINQSLKIFNSKLYKDLTKIYSNNIRLEKHIIDNLPYIFDY